MTKKTEPTSTKIANGIRRVAAELLGWVGLWESRSKDSYKDMSLVMAFIGIFIAVVSLAIIITSIITLF